jgi:hypothetical protein
MQPKVVSARGWSDHTITADYVPVQFFNALDRLQPKMLTAYFEYREDEIAGARDRGLSILESFRVVLKSD